MPIESGKTAYNGDGELITGSLSLTGNAGGGQVLSGYTFYNTDAKSKQTGSMTNRGAWTSTISPGGSVTVPAGYHNGSGWVKANRTYTTVYLGATSGRWGGTFQYNVKSNYPSVYASLSRGNFYAVPYQSITDSGMTGSLTVNQGDNISYDVSSGIVACSSTHYGTGGQVHGWLHYYLYMTY